MSIVVGRLTTLLPNASSAHLFAVGVLGVGTYLTLFLVQDETARRSVSDFGLAVHEAVVGSEPSGQTAQ